MSHERKPVFFLEARFDVVFFEGDFFLTVFLADFLVVVFFAVAMKRGFTGKLRQNLGKRWKERII